MPTTSENIEVQHVYDATGISVPADAAFRSEMERKLVQSWAGGGKWKSGECKICRAPIANPEIEVQVFDQPLRFFVGCCDNCTSIRDAHYYRHLNEKQQVQASPNPEWDANCPALYKELVENLPANIDHKAFKRVIEWNPSFTHGLVCTGNSGRGKTTALWSLYRELERKKYNVVFLTAVELQRQLSEAARDIKDVKHLTHCRVLMIDDLGKEKLTAAVAALLWEVVDARYSNRRPMVITTRFVGSDFESRFGDAVLGIDIRRRLADCCRHVPFVAQEATGGTGGPA